VSLEWGPLSLMSTTEKLLGRNSSGFGLESQECGSGDTLRSPCDNLYPQNVGTNTSGARSVGIVCSRTKDTEFGFVC
jgi:hypothetical protein